MSPLPIWRLSLKSLATQRHRSGWVNAIVVIARDENKARALAVTCTSGSDAELHEEYVDPRVTDCVCIGQAPAGTSESIVVVDFDYSYDTVPMGHLTETGGLIGGS